MKGMSSMGRMEMEISFLFLFGMTHNPIFFSNGPQSFR
jgi:hypothetical protein